MKNTRTDGASAGGEKELLTAVVIFSILSIATGIVFACVPLLNTLGYESGAAAAIFCSIASFAIGAAGAKSADRTFALSSDKSCHVSALRSSIVFSILVIFLNFMTVTAYSYFVNFCNIGNGAFLYLLMTIPTAVLYCCAGFFAGSIFRWPLMILTWLLCFGGSAVFTLFECLNGQRQVAHNLTIGLFSLSGFNGFELTIPDSFAIYRVITCVFGLVFAGLAIAAKSNIKTGLATAGVSLAIILSCALFAGDPTGLRSGHNAMLKELSATKETENAVIHYSPDAFSETEISIAARFTEFYLMEIREALEMEQPWKVQIYAYKDGDQMERHTGARDFYFAQPWNHSLHIEKRGMRTRILKHELVHVMMGEYGKGIFGTPYNIGLIEGVATAVERNYFAGDGLQNNFAAALRAKVISSGGKSINNAGFGSSSMTKSYDMAGGFIGFLMNKYGTDKLKSFYADPNPKKAYGKSFAELNEEWTSWLETQKPLDFEIKQAEYIYDDARFPAFFKTKCPRTGVRMLKNTPADKFIAYMNNNEYDAAVEICEKGFENTGNGAWLTREASIYEKAKNYSGAISALEKVLALEEVPPIVLDATYSRLAVAYAKSGDRDGAEDAVFNRKKLGFEEPGILEFCAQLANTKGFVKLIPYLLEGKIPDDALVEEVLQKEKNMPETRGAIVYMNLYNEGLSAKQMEKLSQYAYFFATNAYGLDKFKYDLLNSLAFKFIYMNEPAKARGLFELARTSAADRAELFNADRNIRIADYFIKNK